MTAVNLFFSYSHKDETFRDELEKHLSSMKREGLINQWHDRRILGGQNIDDAIDKNLEKADVILLLISSDFLDSDYCYSKEMQRALQRKALNECEVIPVILRHCDWRHSPFADLLALPTDGKPIKSFHDLDEGFANVAKNLRKIVENILKKEGPTENLTVKVSQIAPTIPVQNNYHEYRAKSIKLPKKFTDFDKDKFISDAFGTVCKFFENSLKHLQEENAGYQTTYKQIDSKKFEAAIYNQGKIVAKCSIRLDAIFGGNESILYSSDVRGNFSSNGFNISLSTEEKNDELYIKPSNSWGKSENLNFLMAAEYLWTEFISNISNRSYYG